MNKIIIVLLADKSTHENMGRALHALLYAKQAKAKGAEVELIFDGGGVEWPVEMSKKENHLNDLYATLLNGGVIKGVCAFCANAFKVGNELKAIGANFLDDGGGHPDVGGRAARDWRILII